MRHGLLLAVLASGIAGCDGSGLEGHFDVRPESEIADSAEPDTRPDAADADADLDDTEPDTVPDVEGEIADAEDTEILDTDDADADDTEGADMLDSEDADGDTVEDATDTTADIVDTADTEDTLSEPAHKTWRSRLYPEDWSEGVRDKATGAHLQDYSYAGYHNGELVLGDGLGPSGVAGLPRFDVDDFGAIPTRDIEDPVDSTIAFQAAIDAAAEAGGGLVYVPPGLYHIGGALDVTSSRIVIGGEGPERSRLWFTRRVGLNFWAHIYVRSVHHTEAETPVVADAGVFDRVVEVEDASVFSVGDDVVIGQRINYSFLDAYDMTDTWVLFAGSWQPFYRRNVVAVDLERQLVTIDVPLRGPVRKAYGATVRRVSGIVREFGLASVGVASAIAWTEAWSGRQIYTLRLEHVADSWVHDVRSFVSPSAPVFGMGMGAHLQSGGILVEGSKRVTIANTHLEHAQKRAGTGDGILFEIRQSSEILTRESSGRSGRRSFAQNAGFGTSGCVWVRVTSSESAEVPLGPILDEEVPQENGFLHSLATANLIDQSSFADGIRAENMLRENAGAGHTATECVFWNLAGLDVVSLQYGLGYIIGTQPRTQILTQLFLTTGAGTEPVDWVEGARRGSYLEPRSLYDDQLARRLGRRAP